VAIQDTSELALGGRRAAAAGYGVVGKGGATRGLLLHPVLAVEAGSGALLGLVSMQVWNRAAAVRAPRRRRETSAKESQRWIDGARQAGEVLSQASTITAVSDRESDFYELFAAPSCERRSDRAGLPEPAHRGAGRRGRGDCCSASSMSSPSKAASRRPSRQPPAGPSVAPNLPCASRRWRCAGR